MAPRAFAALRAASARRRAAAAAAAASAPWGLDPDDEDDDSDSAAGVHSLTCFTPNVANLSASGAHVAPNTCGGVPLNPTARVSTAGLGRPGWPPPQSHTRTVCLESAATVTILAAPLPGTLGSPRPGPNAIATTARSPGSCRSLATSLPVAMSQTHAHGAPPLRCPVAAQRPDTWVARETISSSCPRKNRCRHALASNTTPMAPHAYTHTTPLYPPAPWLIHSSSNSPSSSPSRVGPGSGASAQVFGAAASMPHLPATEQPYAHSTARSSSGLSALRPAWRSSQSDGANTPVRHGG